MKRSYFSAPYAVWMVVFTIFPIVFVGLYAITTRRADGNDLYTGLANIGNIFGNEGTYMKVLWRSLSLALQCTAICLLLGYPCAYFLASKDFAKHKTLYVLILLPMWMNFLLRTYASMGLLERNGVINSIVTALGFKRLELIGTQGAVLYGMVYNYLPFMILPIHTVLKKMDQRVIEAAQDLGANPVRVFYKVTLPLSIPGIISGITMVFMPSVTTFAISGLLGSGNFMLIGDVIETQFMSANNWNFGSALSLFMTVLILISIGLLNRMDKSKTGNGGGKW
ncbi:MAG: ABC transporter permease [Clostridia bacterium]|nr:ABC transporter permease [Clostridia bacterium]